MMQPSRLTIYEVADIREKLLACQAEQIVLDLERVEACDAAGLQLLVSLTKTAMENKRLIRIANLSEPICTALRTAGMESETFQPSQGN